MTWADVKSVVIIALGVLLGWLLILLVKAVTTL